MLRVLLLIIVIGTIVPVIWPMFVATDTDVQAMTETDDATVTLQSLYPIMLVVVGILIAAGLVFYGLRQFHLIN